MRQNRALRRWGGWRAFVADSKPSPLRSEPAAAKVHEDTPSPPSGRPEGKRKMASKLETVTRKAPAGDKAVSDGEAQEAFRTVLKWIGEDPDPRRPA